MEKLKAKCSVCESEFSQKKNLYVHLRNIHKIEPLKPKLLQQTFECELCKNKFVSRSSLTRHTKSIHFFDGVSCKDYQGRSAKGIRLICPQLPCNERSVNYVNLRQHLEEQHNINIEFEALTFYSSAEFEKWKEQMQNETHSFYSLDTGVRPLSNGRTKKTYNCHRSYSHKSKGRNIRTVTSVSNKIGRACPARLEVMFQNDEQSTISVKFWKTHCGHSKTLGRGTAVVLSDGRIQCDSCKTIFFMQHHFETHLCIEKGKKTKKIPCPECHKTFSTRFNLRRHSHYHSQKTPFECPTCKKLFTRKEALDRHRLTHENGEPFKCQMCNKSFLEADTLEEHTKIHSREKPFKCDHCGKMFTRKHSVFIHIKCVHKLDPDPSEKCLLCNKRFKNKLQLVEHIKDHTKVERDDHTETNTDKPLTECAIGPVVKIKKEEIFSAVNEPLVKYEDKSVELREIVEPKIEPKEEFFEICENSAEAFAYLVAEIDEDAKVFNIKEESS